MELNKNFTPNFEVRTKNFQPGYYTIENFNGVPTYCLAYKNTRKNARSINNSGLMLECFEELPERHTVNAHKIKK
jgi:hypothetical protein